MLEPGRSSSPWPPVKHFLLHMYGWWDQTTIDIAMCHAEHGGWAPSARYDAAASASEPRQQRTGKKNLRQLDVLWFLFFLNVYNCRLIIQ